MIHYIIIKLVSFNWSIFWSAFSAIGTVMAVVVAYWQIRKQTEERKSDLEKEQASKISGWLTSETPDTTSIVECSNTIYAVSNLRNNSDSPIYDVYLLSSHMRSSENPKEMMISHYVHFDIVPPGNKEIVVGTMGAMMGGNRPALALLFTDFRGVAWLRTNKGKLMKMEEDCFYEFIENTKIGAGPFSEGGICSLE